MNLKLLVSSMTLAICTGAPSAMARPKQKEKNTTPLTDTVTTMYYYTNSINKCLVLGSQSGQKLYEIRPWLLKDKALKSLDNITSNDTLVLYFEKQNSSYAIPAIELKVEKNRCILTARKIYKISNISQKER